MALSSRASLIPTNLMNKLIELVTVGRKHEA